MSSMAKLQTSSSPRTLAITGGKGGVGKSNLVLGLAVALGRWGRKVLLVDGDLGLANLDVLLGLNPTGTMEQLVSGEAKIADVLLEGPAGIRILPAASGVPDLAKLDASARRRVFEVLSESSEGADEVLVDTGAGLGDAPLALQLAASRVLLVTTPEPTSLVDAYATLKVLWSADPSKPVDLVVNAARNDEEAEKVHGQLAKAARHFLGGELGWLGPVYSDEKIPEAVRRQRSLMEIFPQCKAAACYERIAMRLISAPSEVELPKHGFWDRMFWASEQELPH